jgi:sorbitol-specific phosphotransferase system component IIC
MKYMIVNTHNPESCPMVNTAAREVLISGTKRMADVAKSLGITVLGIWADLPAHTTFMLFDSPGAEALGKMAMELHLMDWSTSITHPVITMEESMAQLAKAK